MKNTIWIRTSIIAFTFIILVFSCNETSNKKIEQEVKPVESTTTSITEQQQTQDQAKEEKEIIEVLEKIFIAVGNQNAKELGELATEKASIAWTYLQEGTWMNKVVTVEEYLQKIIDNKNPKPIAETAEGYNITITEDRLAMVKAKTIISQFGVPRTREINHIIMIKEKDDWKLFSIAWTVDQIPDEERKFDLNLFAHNYAQVWSGIRPEFVAMFFEENGSLQVNDNKPAEGRTQITEVAQGFMHDLPDMVVKYDSLVTKPTRTEFHWTLTGTNSGPGGTGNKVKVSGYEHWQMGENGLILKSQGHFPSEEYNRQIESGTEN